MTETAAKQGPLQKGHPWTHRAPRMQVLELQQTLIETQRDRDAAGNHVAEGQAAIAELARQKAEAPKGLRHGAQLLQDRTKELADAEAQAAALDQELAKSAERQRLKAILAPVAGTVQQLSVHTVGGMIEPGQTLMAIVPDDSGIEIEAMIQNQDIGFVHEGEEAVIKLEAFPFTRYGTVPGKIKIVSEDAVGGQSSDGASSNPLPLQGEGGGGGASALGASPSAAGALYYTARVTLDRSTMNIDGKNVKLTPGMAATVEIKTGRRKLIEFLLSPLMKMTGEAGRER